MGITEQYDDLLTDVLEILFKEKSERDKQVQIGPSEIGGCPRAVWHRLQATPEVNVETLGLQAWIGTAVHERIERRLKWLDPFEDRFLREVEVSHEGMTGHVDLYDIEKRRVIDWKTTVKAKLTKLPQDQQLTQVQLYGWLLASTGRPVDTVHLVYLPRDASERHIKIHSEPYDESVALQGLAWLRNIETMVEAPDPGADMKVFFCRDYCQFYDKSGEIGCPSRW